MTQPTCREIVEFFVDYLDHVLEPAQLHEFERHLATCDDCVVYLRSYEQAVRLAKAAFADSEASAGEQFPRALVEAIVAARRRTP